MGTSSVRPCSKENRAAPELPERPGTDCRLVAVRAARILRPRSQVGARYYVGYPGKHWEHDYGVLSGRCNREEVATVLGGVVGAVVGSRTSAEENRTVATIAGAVTGAFIGNWIGRKLDSADRYRLPVATGNLADRIALQRKSMKKQAEDAGDTQGPEHAPVQPEHCHERTCGDGSCHVIQ